MSNFKLFKCVALFGVVALGATGCVSATTAYPLQSTVALNVVSDEPFYEDDYEQDEYFAEYEDRYDPVEYEDVQYAKFRERKRLKRKRALKRKKRKAAAKPIAKRKIAKPAAKRRAVRNTPARIRVNTSRYIYEGNEKYCSQGKLDCNGFVNER